MKKYIVVVILILSFHANAQKELWGVTQQTPYPTGEQGNIVKFDLNGENAVTVHSFNYTTGKVPFGKLFLASNGKLYGTTAFGGIGSTNKKCPTRQNCNSNRPRKAVICPCRSNYKFYYF